MKQCFFQFALCSEKQSTIDTNHPILPTLLDDLAVDADSQEQPFRSPLVHLEPVGGEQEAVFKEASLQCVQNCVLDFLETAAANVCRDPKSGPHFQGGQHPDHPFLRSNKGPDLVGLKFMDDATPEHPIIEPDSVCGRRFKPACDGAPRHPLDSSHG